MVGSRAVHVRVAALAAAVALALVPSAAWAANCMPGSGSAAFGEAFARHGALFAIATAFGAGVLASLTPCVYPMVPITVSVFGATGAGASRSRAVLLSASFVAGICALFTPLGIASALTGKLLGSALASAWVVGGLAALFLVLAASMFGAFELALPSSLQNRLAGVGGVGARGAFVMGLVMGLVAAPCTGPFLTGIVTLLASTKNVALGGAALFAFALGLGLVFFVAGAFGASLPRGGAWMVGVKWVSGLGLAYMAFASLRDRFEPVRALVEHPAPAFGAAAAVTLAVGLVLGALHVLSERRRSRLANLSRAFRLASIVPAVAGAALFFTWTRLDHDVAPGEPPIAWMTDEAAAVAKARAEGRPLVVDFGAHWCPGCRELDQKVFSRPEVRKAARPFVALKVDETSDADDKEEVRVRWGVVGLPTVIFLDGEGRETARILDGETKPSAMVAALKCTAGPAPRVVVGMR